MDGIGEDDRFKSLFADADFQIDEESEVRSMGWLMTLSTVRYACKD